MIFRLRVYHFQFRVLESVYFPPGKAGNVLRGALGAVLETHFDGSREPRAARPSGLGDPPRPFVLRAAHLDGKRFEPGEMFSFDVHVFDLSGQWLETFTGAFEAWASTGLGPRRGRVELPEPARCEDVCLDLTATAAASRCGLLFRTPTELKGNSARDEMPFGVLFARVRDRIGTLRSLYGEGPLPMEFTGPADRAALVRTVRCDLRYAQVWRRSSRTGAVHGIGGATGRVDYEGDLGEFLPWLHAASWAGVGRHTVWGNGAIEVLHAE